MPIPDLVSFPIFTTGVKASEAASGLCPALTGEVAPIFVDGQYVSVPPDGDYLVDRTDQVVSELGFRRALRRHYDGQVVGHNLGSGQGKPFRDSSNKIIKIKSIKPLTDRLSVYEQDHVIFINYDNSAFETTLEYVQGGLYQMWGSEFFTPGTKVPGTVGDNYILTPDHAGFGFTFELAVAKICVRIPKNRHFTGNHRIFVGTEDNRSRFGYFMTMTDTDIAKYGEWADFTAKCGYALRQYEYFTGADPVKIVVTVGDQPITFGTPGFELYIFFDLVQY